MIVVIIVLFANILVGSANITFGEVMDTFVGNRNTSSDILLKIRIPRALAAMLLGGALSLSGYLLQTFFHNPIAGPFVLGISSGAKMMVAVVMIFLLGKSIRVSSFVLILAAFAGAIISMLFVLLMSKRVQGMSMLVISGVMIGYICSAITDFMVTFAQDADIVNLHNWSRGSFSGMSWSNVCVMTVVVLAASFAVFMLSKPIGAYQLGENYAENMGVNVRYLRIVLILLSSVLSGCVVAYAGPISFTVPINIPPEPVTGFFILPALFTISMIIFLISSTS